jgi:predicted LPLAT superfamily acyltransferase
VSENWSNISERGSIFWIQIAAAIFKLLGRRVTLILITPFLLFYYMTGHTQRRASSSYLKRLYAAQILPSKPGISEGLKHYLAFAEAMIDRLAGWTGKIKPQDIAGVDDDDFSNAKANGKGGLVLTAHLGNTDLIRAIATLNKRFKVTVLMHTQNAQKYNSVIQHFSPDSGISIVEVSNIDVSVAIKLSGAIERGEWVVVAADRQAPGAIAKANDPRVKLLGDDVAYPLGPYILGSALKCPVYFLVCIRSKGDTPFRIIFETIAERFDLPRKDRESALKAYMSAYSKCLEAAISQAPYQWFNFFEFWDKDKTSQ